ncbi:ras association domain-containing protein 8 [Triplophysa rosa]|uniref:Ras association domain-containing protein 8 n=1 Tax=Triplophysa rosa TaxID=992332 RepID=A0A9W7TGE0_TRIRA|nr:ras association domain-containing protein 8 [Triplophysa rosa]KAI7798208.1 putative ras association domain-containing protein 8 [Triplophysa rosa]
MEVKVYVEGVQRIVCGVTKNTTCQEVVIALAQALGRTGRYTLQEKFKEYERTLTPDEHLLESLEKYGEQAKEVQLILKHIGPSLGEESFLSWAQMRRAGAGRARRGSGVLDLHRQSLPPLSHLCLHSEPPPEEPKRPKRKSLTLMEEAWGWLENLGRGSKQQSGRDKGKNKEGNKGNGHLDSTSLKPTKSSLTSGGPHGKDKKDKNRVALHQPLISCLGNRGRRNDESRLSARREKDSKEVVEKDLKAIRTDKPLVPVVQMSSSHKTDSEETEASRQLIIQQQASLQELKIKISSTDQQIRELEDQQATKQNSESEDEEQLKFWLNELKAEEGFERDLQQQFFQIKEEADKCKAKIKEYKEKLLSMDLNFEQQQIDHENLTGQTDVSYPELQHIEQSVKQTESSVDTSQGNGETKRVVTTLNSNVPYVFVSANQTSHPPLSGPADLREWWTRWSQSQNQTTGTKPKIHRSEITIHIGSTRV